jgi:hypothetical protein
MSDYTRAIIDYVENDDAKEMRDTFYAALQDRVLQHIENHKIEVAKSLIAPHEEVASEEEQ